VLSADERRRRRANRPFVPTAVLDLDAAALPAELSVPSTYERVWILVRWGGRPIGQLTLPVRHGRVSSDRLREAVSELAAGPILEQWLGDYLGLDPAPGTGAGPATIAVCTRDRPEDLERCLAALSRLPDDGHEVLVIDSASRTDETRQVVARVPRVRYVREDQPGLDVARNRALREARHPIVAFTDDDAVPDPGWLRGLVGCFEDGRVMAATGLTVPLELETEAQEWFERTNGFGRGFARTVFPGTSHSPFLVARIGAGVNMALRRDVLDLVGPFDEALDAGTPTRSGGDHDMFTRILTEGYTIVYEPSALSRHRHRRDWQGLRDTVFGYGVGVYAHLTKHFVCHREVGAPLLAIAWLQIQASALVRAVFRRPGHIPLDLVLAELRGCAAGPWAYRAARRARVARSGDRS
jgi:glycosyltransferase involved in cell wall biosynthesis